MHLFFLAFQCIYGCSDEGGEEGVGRRGVRFLVEERERERERERENTFRSQMKGGGGGGGGEKVKPLRVWKSVTGESAQDVCKKGNLLFFLF